MSVQFVFFCFILWLFFNGITLWSLPVWIQASIVSFLVVFLLWKMGDKVLAKAKKNEPKIHFILMKIDTFADKICKRFRLVNMSDDMKIVEPLNLEKETIGVLLCFFFIHAAEFIRLVCISKDDETDSRFTLVAADAKEIASISDLSWLKTMFQEKNIRKWELTIKYEDIEYMILGETNSDEFEIFVPLDDDDKYIPVFVKALSGLYSLCLIISWNKKVYRIDEAAIITSVYTLLRYPDIKDEFVSGIHDNKFVFLKRDCISVNGFTAEQLARKYNLQPLIAYHILCLLREDPEAVIHELEKRVVKDI